MLQINKIPSYLSPSAVTKAIKMPNSFYLSRLSGLDVPRESQALPAAVGSAFDYLLKVHMANTKFQNKKHIVDKMMEEVEDHQSEAILAGRRLLNTYLTSAYDVKEFADIEVHNSHIVEYRDKKIPMFGKLDATSHGSGSFEGSVIPFDWKVSGYCSDQSPKQGFFRSWKDGRPKVRHDLYREDMPFESIDVDWAFQLCVYGWLIGYKVGEPFQVRIDQLSYRQGNITVTQYRGVISEEFQILTFNRAYQIWEAINSGSYVRLLASTKDANLVWLASLRESWF